MTTKLTKSVVRESGARAPYKANEYRNIVVGMHRNDTITFRPKGTQFKLVADIRDLYYHVLKLHAAQEKANKKAAKLAKKRGKEL